MSEKRLIPDINQRYFRRLAIYTDRISFAELRASNILKIRISGRDIYIPHDFIANSFVPKKDFLEKIKELIDQIINDQNSILIDPRNQEGVIRLFLAEYKSLELAGLGLIANLANGMDDVRFVIKNSQKAGVVIGRSPISGLNQLTVRALYQRFFSKYRITECRVVDIKAVIQIDKENDRQVIEYIEGFNFNEFFDEQNINYKSDESMILEKGKNLLREIISALEKLEFKWQTIKKTSLEKKSPFKAKYKLLIDKLVSGRVLKKIKDNISKANLLLGTKVFNKNDIATIFFLLESIFDFDGIIHPNAYSEISKESIFYKKSPEKMDLGNIMWDKNGETFVIVDPSLK